MWTRMNILPLMILAFLCSVADALNPIVVKGYKFFDSETGEPILFRGIDYYPRPNKGDLLNHNSVDLFSNEHRDIWQRDVEHLKELGVNAVRLYSVDPDAQHDEFMCAMNAAGIYVIVELASACPICAVTRDKAPDCYPVELKTRGQQIMQEFVQYENTLAFSTGNEVNHFAPDGQPEWNAPCQKKFLRDMRAYLDKCNMRKVPIGLVAADSDRVANALYYNCGDDSLEHAEWYGLNSYVFCDGQAETFEEAEGFVSLCESFEEMAYSIPVLLTEFGCLSDTFATEKGYEGQRNFHQAQWMLTEPQVQEQFQGGFVFEYSIEMENAFSQSPYPFKQFGKQNFGVGYFSPENCDDVDTPCEYKPLPEYYHLQDAYTYARNVSSDMNDDVSMNTFEVSKNRTERSKCPKDFPSIKSYRWKADHTADLKCPSQRQASFTCGAHFGGVSTKQAPGTTWTLTVVVLATVLGLAVVGVKWLRSKRAQRALPWPTNLVIPRVGRSCDSFDSSDESTGLLSMQDYGKSTPYRAIDSDSSWDENSRSDEK